MTTERMGTLVNWLSRSSTGLTVWLLKQRVNLETRTPCVLFKYSHHVRTPHATCPHQPSLIAIENLVIVQFRGGLAAPRTAPNSSQRHTATHDLT